MLIRSSWGCCASLERAHEGLGCSPVGASWAWCPKQGSEAMLQREHLWD